MFVESDLALVVRLAERFVPDRLLFFVADFFADFFAVFIVLLSLSWVVDPPDRGILVEPA